MRVTELICIARYFNQIQDIVEKSKFHAINEANKESLEAIPAKITEDLLDGFNEMLNEIYEEITIMKRNDD